MQITIAERFCGPSSSGNGGWTAGCLAHALRVATGTTDPITVRLAAPPPLDKPLEVLLEVVSDDSADLTVATLHDNHFTIATATTAPGWTGEPVPFVDPATAAATASSYVAPDQHPFPQCFVCGPAREPGDGMRLTPGHLSGGGTACLWRPADTRGPGSDTTEASVTEPFIWSALDCPGGWASDFLGRPMVLGTMTTKLFAPPSSNDVTVVTGRLDRTDDRRSWTSSSLWSAEGVLLAQANAIWIGVDPAFFNTILKPST